MDEEKRNFLGRIIDFLWGHERIQGSPGVQGPSPNSEDHALFNRLVQESSRHASYVRRLKTDVLQGTKLIDEILTLMFNLKRPVGTYLKSSIITALDQRPLSTQWRVFYLYIDESIDFPQADEVQDWFYDRVSKLSEESTNLSSFLDERFRIHQLLLNRAAAPEKFDPKDKNHPKILPNLFRCQFSVCRKRFPQGFSDDIFVVGRMPLHDVQEIDRHRFKQSNTSASGPETPNIYLAVTVKAAGQHENKPIRFNAHRFGQRSDNSPQREYSLFIGNWRTEWEFSIGSAEHDEIQHASMSDNSARLTLHNLQRTNNSWDYQGPDPSLPPWMKFFNMDMTRTTDKDIRLCRVKSPTLDHPLVNVLSRPQFRQEISLIGRMLPRSGGQLQQFNNVTDTAFRDAVRDLHAVSAVEVRDSLWLALTVEDQIVRVSQNDKKGWESLSLADGATFAIGETEYRWHLGRNDLYPEAFVGALSIYPGTSEASGFKTQLNVDKDAEGFLVSYDGHFPRTLNPDELLGANGVVSIKCVEVSDEGRGKYAFLPVQQPKPTNPFFAFQPVYSREKGWPAGKVWLTYKGDKSSDLHRDEQSGEVRFNGERVLAEDHSYHLIGGSSLFQLKVSGTPYIGSASMARGSSSAPVVAPIAPTGPSPEPEPQFSTSSEFTPLSIQIQLLKTRWGGYDVKDADRSNFAAHFHLIDSDGPPFFLKAYFPRSVESAKRESAFYEFYRDRAQSVFLCSPKILRVNEDTDEAPWGLIFPLLHTYEKYFSSVGQATVAQAAAVGLGMATLFEAMAKDGLINFDIDVSQFCFDQSGRLVIVDFDNVYQILDDPKNEDKVAPLLGIINARQLPAKNSSLPPEATTFSKTFNPIERRRALAQIGPAFSTYMLAVVVLQILKANELPFRKGTLLRRAAAENLDDLDVKRFEDLLAEMLSPAISDRPEPAAARQRLEQVVKSFAAKNERALADCARLLSVDLAEA